MAVLCWKSTTVTVPLSGSVGVRHSFVKSPCLNLRFTPRRPDFVLSFPKSTTAITPFRTKSACWPATATSRSVSDRRSKVALEPSKSIEFSPNWGTLAKSKVVDALKRSAIALVVVGHVLLAGHRRCAWAGYPHFLRRRGPPPETEPSPLPPLTRKEKIFLSGFFLCCCYVIYLNIKMDREARRRQVVMLQVGLLGTPTSLRSDLNQIAASLSTSTTAALKRKRVLTDTIHVLSCHLDHCISVYTYDWVTANLSRAEMIVDELYTEEGRKSENLDNMRGLTTTELNNEYIVVTVIIALSQYRWGSPMKGRTEVKERLETFRNIPHWAIEAIELVWTPRKENVTLSKKEFHEKYPLLELGPLLEERTALS